MLTVWNWTELEAEPTKFARMTPSAIPKTWTLKIRTGILTGKRRAMMIGKWAEMPRKLDACEGYTSCVSF